jgi:hypothetical protein
MGKNNSYPLPSANSSVVAPRVISIHRYWLADHKYDGLQTNEFVSGMYIFFPINVT